MRYGYGIGVYNIMTNRRKCIIKTNQAQYVYHSEYNKESEIKAVDNISVEIQKGQFIAVIGKNGSGKSTFARLLNALLLPTEGLVYVRGMDTKDEKNLWEIRRSVGMVFQNPDNQIIGTTVEEDIAFGPENIGVKPEEIRKRVDSVLKTVGITGYGEHPPHLLSGGQKQRVAIAGILAMKPECIILDEATAMLDPAGRKEVMQVLKSLNKKNNITIIHITHHMDEVTEADRVLVVDKGRVIMDGIPSDVFSNVNEIKHMGLDVPQITELLYELNNRGFNLPVNIIDIDKAYDIILNIINDKDSK